MHRLHITLPLIKYMSGAYSLGTLAEFAVCKLLLYKLIPALFTLRHNYSFLTKDLLSLF